MRRKPIALIVVLLAAAALYARRKPHVDINAPGVTRTYAKPIPSTPPKDQVNILFEPLKEEADEAHYRWTIVADRSYQTRNINGELVELSRSAALGDAKNPLPNAHEIEAHLLRKGFTVEATYTLRAVPVKVTIGDTATLEIGNDLSIESKTTIADVPATLSLIKLAQVATQDSGFQNLPFDAPLLKFSSPNTKPFRLKLPL